MQSEEGESTEQHAHAQSPNEPATGEEAVSISITA